MLTEEVKFSAEQFVVNDDWILHETRLVPEDGVSNKKG